MESMSSTSSGSAFQVIAISPHGLSIHRLKRKHPICLLNRLIGLPCYLYGSVNIYALQVLEFPHVMHSPLVGYSTALLHVLKCITAHFSRLK